MGFVPFTLFFLTFVLLYLAYLINKLSQKEKSLQSEKLSIDKQLQRIYDLLPNFIETSKYHINHENGFIEELINTRNQLIRANSYEEKALANNNLVDSLKFFLNSGNKIESECLQ